MPHESRWATIRWASAGPTPGRRSSSPTVAASTLITVSRRAGPSRSCAERSVLSRAPPFPGALLRGDFDGRERFFDFGCPVALPTAAICASSRAAAAGSTGSRAAFHARSARPQTRMAPHAPRARRSPGVGMRESLASARVRRVIKSARAVSNDCRPYAMSTGVMPCQPSAGAPGGSRRLYEVRRMLIGRPFRPTASSTRR